MAPKKNNRNTKDKTTTHKFKKQTHNRVSGRAESNKYFGCGICKADHRIISCKKFNNLNLEQKYRIISKLHYCSNCLARNHLLDKCTNKARCRICGHKHHTVLHGHGKILQGLSTSEQKDGLNQTSLASSHTTKSIGLPSSLHKVLVPTAEVLATTNDGCISLRAILNPSSTSSRIANSFVEKYKLQTFQLDDKKYVKLMITPNMSSTIKYEMYMMVVRELPKKPYTTSIKSSLKEKFGNLSLADPKFYENDPVMVELGGDLYSRVLKSNIIHIDGGSLMAQDSTLGWLIMGSYSG